MSKRANAFLDTYNELVEAGGMDKVHRLILLERAANQRHWAKKVSDAVEYGARFKDTTKLVAAVSAVVVEMEEQAEEYEDDK